MLLERDSELGALAHALETSRSSGRLVLIRGEAGVGKSSLVREFLTLHGQAARVLVGFCDDLSTPQPLGPFWDMARADESDLAESLETHDLQRVLNSLLELVSRSLRPTILVIEDAHWADEATIDVIRYLGRRIETTHGLIILTFRDTALDQDHPLRGLIGSLPPDSVLRLRLVGLSADAVAELAAGLADPVTLMELTDGNPFLVKEMLTSGSVQIPRSVEVAVLGRMAKLTTAGRHLVELASVVPGEVSVDLLEAVLGSAEDVKEGEHAGLIQTRGESIAFRHELIRRTVEDSLSVGRRKELNRRVLEWLLISNRDEAARIVHHAQATGDVDVLVEYAPLAAREATNAGGHREAAAHYRTLEPHLDRFPTAQRAVLLEEWADRERDLDDYPMAFQILERALRSYREEGGDLSLVRALLKAVEYAQPVDVHEANALLEVALDLLHDAPTGPELAQAVNLQAWLKLTSGHLHEASVLADHAIDLARMAGADSTLIHALIIKGSSRYQMGEPEAIDMLESARNVAKERGTLFEQARAAYNLCIQAIRGNDIRRARDVIGDLEALAAAADLPLFTIPLLALRAELAFGLGEWRFADDLLSDALTSESAPSSIWAPDVDLLLGIIESRRDRPDASVLLKRLWEHEADRGDIAFNCRVAAALSEHLWLTGTTDQKILQDFDVLLSQAVALRHQWSAARLAFWLRKLDSSQDAPGSAPEPYLLMMTGRSAEAAQIWETLGYPYEQAIALAEADDKSRVEAMERLETLGARGVAARLRRGLRERGVQIPRGRARSTRSHPVGLTARQHEVLTLLAKNLSNHEIADQLFLSPRTVENHVAAVLRRLDASTRQDAVASAAAQGLFSHDPVRTVISE